MLLIALLILAIGTCVVMGFEVPLELVKGLVVNLAGLVTGLVELAKELFVWLGSVL